MQLKKGSENPLEILLDEWIQEKQKQEPGKSEFLPRWYTWVEGDHHD